MYSAKRRLRMSRHPAWSVSKARGPVVFATGGTVVSGQTIYHVFQTSGIFNVETIPIDGKINYLLVGGGGGGGDRTGGGGGAGGVVSGQFTPSIRSYAITVGDGGIGGQAEGGTVGSPLGVGSRGGDSIISYVSRALGGGGGGTLDGIASGIYGSGGGGGSGTSATSGTTGQGFAGGAGSGGSNYSGGGGGGAGGAGQTAATSIGGVGTSAYSDHLLAVGYGTTFATTPHSPISGGVAYIGGGGGGGGSIVGTVPPGRPGGIGGGGTGDWTDTVITAGTSNTGGGGGGTRSNDVTSIGRKGGSGLALLWYSSEIPPEIPPQGQVPTPWTPEFLAETRVWLDANDPSTTGIASTNGTALKSWYDKSGNNRNAVAEGSPLLVSNLQNGLPGIRTATSPRAAFAIDIAPLFFMTDVHWFFVYKTNSTSAYPSPINRTHSAYQGQAQYANQRSFFSGSYSTTLYSPWNHGSASPNGPLNNTSICGQVVYCPNGDSVTASVPGTSFKEYINGQEQVLTPDGAASSFRYDDRTSTKVYIARRSDETVSFNGDFFEILIFNTTLSTDTRQKIEGYLAWKWDLVSKLSDSHPYKTASPTYTPPPPPPPFSLLVDYGTLAVWLDATDVTGTGTNPSNGSIVNTWVNKVQGGGNATGSGNPVLSSIGANGTQGIYLNGTSMAYGGTMTNTGTVCTAFVVATMTNAGTASYGRLLSLAGSINNDYGSSTHIVPFLRNDTQPSSISSWRAGYKSTKSIPAYDTLFYATCIADGTNITNFVNGISGSGLASTGSFAITNYAVGTIPNSVNTLWKGYVCEVIVYNSALSVASREAVESYLAKKWGI